MSKVDQKAAEAARRAQAARLEQARLMAAQVAALKAATEAHGTAPTANPNQQVSKEVFVANSQVAATAEERAAIFEQADTDHVAGLSAAEIEQMYAMTGVVPLAPPSDDVDQALSADGFDQAQLEDAAASVETLADVDAVMAAAAAAGGLDERAALDVMLKTLADQPGEDFRALYGRIGAHYTRLGHRDQGAAVSGLETAGDYVRLGVLRALTGEDDPIFGLGEALGHVFSAADVDALMAGARAAGMDAAYQREMLGRLIREWGPDIPEDLRGACNAVASQLGRLGAPEEAAAMRYLAQPAVDDDLAREIHDALANQEPLAGLLANAGVAVEREQAEATGDVEAAFDAIDAALDAQQALQAKCDLANVTLTQGLALLEGCPEKSKELFTAKFYEAHPEFDQLAAASAAVATLVAEHQDLVTLALQSAHGTFDGVDAEMLEQALVVTAGVPGQEAAAGAIVAELLAHPETVPESRLARIAEEVLPTLVPRLVEAQLAALGPHGDPSKAMSAFLQSPLGRAIDRIGDLVDTGKDVYRVLGPIKTFATEFKTFAEHLTRGPGGAADAAAQLERLTAAPDVSKLGVAMASLGVVLGVVKFGNASGFAERASAVITTAAAGAQLASAVGISLMRVSAKGVASDLLHKAGPAAQILTSCLDLFNAIDDGDALGIANAAISAIVGGLALAGVPGVGWITAAATVGTLIIGLWQANEVAAKRDREIDALLGQLGLDAPLVEFLRVSEGSPLLDLGLTGDQAADLLEAHGDTAMRVLTLAGPRFRSTMTDVLGARGYIGLVEDLAALPPAIREQALRAINEIDLNQQVFSDPLGADEIEYCIRQAVGPPQGSPHQDAEAFQAELAAMEASYAALFPLFGLEWQGLE